MLRITRPGGGGAYNASPAISASRRARNTNLGGWVGPHKNSFWCKFRDIGSTFSGSNDVINAKFSSFMVQRVGHHFSWPGTQTKTDSFNPQKADKEQWNGLSGIIAQIWSHVNRFGARGQNILGSSTTYFSHLAFFYNNFRTICSTATNLSSSFFSRWDQSSDTQFCQKKFKIWPSAQFWDTGQIRSYLVILGIIRFGVTRLNNF